ALATEARAGALAEAAADAESGMAFLSRLYAHQLGAGHALMMRIAGGAHRALDRAAAEAVAPTAALRPPPIPPPPRDRLPPGPPPAPPPAPDGPPRRVRALVGGAPAPPPPPPPPANDSAASLPAATAGHGVLRPDSTTAGATTSLLRAAGESLPRTRSGGRGGG